ncbi:hypothetical protein HYT91_00305, partial [Candidatus Pacearchaeota archaeon]|nr:hypothetical protein [Candidatus Pacearchaeota archaeon]
MTKNNLVEKVLSGVKNFAGKTFLYTSLIAAPLIYSSNANAQAPKDKFVEGAKVNVISPSGGLLEGETIKAHGNWYFVVDDKENKSNPLGVVLAHAESSDRIGSYSAGNIRFKPNLYFTPEQAKDSSETVAGRIELKEEGAFAVDGKETKEIIEKADAKGGGTLFVTKIGNQELLVPLNAMTLNGKQYFMPYLASEKDSAVAKGKKTNFASIPLVDKEGNSTNQIVEYDGDVSLANPNDIYSWKLDESKSTKEIIENSELLKKLIVKNGYPASEENILQTGECKKFLQYNEEEKAAPEEK